MPALTSSPCRLPLVVVSLIAGETLGLWLGNAASAWPLALLVVLCVSSLGYAWRWRGWHMVALVLLGMTLFWRATAARYEAQREAEWARGPFSGVFEVIGVPRVGRADAQGMRRVSFATRCDIGKLNIAFSQPLDAAPPREGERWRCAGWLECRAGEYFRSRRLWVKGRGTFAVRESGPRGLRAWLIRVRHGLSRRMGIGLQDSPWVADLHRAMVLGERAGLKREMRDVFTSAGTIHVFAISGLHVMVVAQLLMCLLGVMLFPRRWSGILLLPVLWLYVQLIGAPPSAVRAAAMASVYYVAPFFCRRPNALVAWEVTLVVFALVDPIGLFGVGSMLSFTVILSILLYLRWMQGVSRYAWLGVSFVAWAAGAPIVAHVFSRITPGGLLANLVMVPLACVSVLASVLGALASCFSTWLAAHVNNFAALFTEAMTGVSWAVAKVPGGDFDVQPWSLVLCAAWYVGVILIFVWMKMVLSRRQNSMMS